MAGRSAEDELMDLFTDDEVKEALEALPEQFRIAVLLGRRRGVLLQGDRRDPRHPIGTVMSRLHRGRKALQKQLYEFAVARGLVRDDGTEGRPWRSDADPERATPWLTAKRHSESSRPSSTAS